MFCDWLSRCTVAGACLDAHHAFVVQYEEKGDHSLAMHVDDSEVTLNVSVNDGFTDASLVFCGQLSEYDKLLRHSFTYAHEIGRAVMHRGMYKRDHESNCSQQVIGSPGSHRHGASPISGGERLNLILWCLSSPFRETDAF